MDSTTRTIRVYDTAGSRINYSPLGGCKPISISMNALTSGPMVSYFWDFGDGDQKTTSSPLTTHDFVTPGSFTVTVVATDDAGHTGTTTVTVAVVTDAPIADFTFSPGAPTAGTTVNFNSTTSTPSQGRTITGFSWNFGDGATSTAATPSHAFAAAGDYNVVLTVTDNAGKTGRVTKTVSVK